MGEALVELLTGTVVGVALGCGGGWLLRRARRTGWAADDFAGVAVLALALAVYAAALVVNGNGFVAAFSGGLAFGGVAGRRGPAELTFLEQASGLVSLLVWLTFGVIVVLLMPDRVEGATLLYAVLSLTIVRMVPVALALVGTGFDRRTVAFIGWFGPRGLASLVFALLALEELGRGADAAVAVIGTTVLLGVVAHGVSAGPLATRYGEATPLEGPNRAVPSRTCPCAGCPVAPAPEVEQHVAGLRAPARVSARARRLSARPGGRCPGRGRRRRSTWPRSSRRTRSRLR